MLEDEVLMEVEASEDAEGEIEYLIRYCRSGHRMDAWKKEGIIIIK